MKGSAIFLMVMGHVLSSLFPNPVYVLEHEPRCLMVLFRVIYSFHMPLLFFCSGIVSVRLLHGWNNFGHTLWRRFCTLIVPFFVVGFLRYAIGGPFLDYWFLWTLFQFIVVTMLIDMVTHYFGKYSKAYFITLLMTVAIITTLLSKKAEAYDVLPFIDFGHWSMYLFFVCGVLFDRCKIVKSVLAKNCIYTLLLVIFMFLTYYITITNHRPLGISYLRVIIPLSAIGVVLYLFKECWDNESRVILFFRNIGFYSLEIYLLHFFVIPPLYVLGSFLVDYANGGGGEVLYSQKF